MAPAPDRVRVRRAAAPNLPAPGALPPLPSGESEDRMAEKKQDAPATDADADGPASGSVDNPIAPDEAQPGDRSELGANLGGPVDVFPGARRGGLDHATPGAPVPSNRTGPEKRGT